MATITISDKQLYDYSRDCLASKCRDFDYVLTNDTCLDRTYPTTFKDTKGHEFNSLDHFLAYSKMIAFEASPKVLSAYLRYYVVEYPVCRHCDENNHEYKIREPYSSELALIPAVRKVHWKLTHVAAACEGILLLAQQNEDFRSALLSTGKNILCECSANILWGTDCDMLGSQLRNPITWKGENGYGQALMVVRNILKRGIH